MNPKWYHIDGMGVIGSLLAWRLSAMGERFTWWDTEEQVNAWRACTGIIYPSGDAFDMQNYRRWVETHQNYPWNAIGSNHLEMAMYWFSSKNPPHSGKYEVHSFDNIPLRLASLNSYHFNAQTFVAKTREHFEQYRFRSANPEVRFTAHGFNGRLGRYLWGWTALVELEFSEVYPDLHLTRNALYLREGRYKIYYAYPCPGTPFHYVGTSLINQTRPKELDIAPKFEKFERHLERATEGTVKVNHVDKFLQGWRPVAGGEDSGELAERHDRTVVVKPLWNSGVRHAPAVIDAVLKAGGLA